MIGILAGSFLGGWFFIEVFSKCNFLGNFFRECRVCRAREFVVLSNYAKDLSSFLFWIEEISYTSNRISTYDVCIWDGKEIHEIRQMLRGW